MDRGHLAEYDRVCGFPLRDVLPATYPHIVAFPLSMELMTRSDFPFAVIGLVHIANRIEQLRPIGADESLSVRVRTEDLGEHDKGTKFEIAAEVEAGGEPAWRSRSTYLHREERVVRRRSRRPSRAAPAEGRVEGAGRRGPPLRGRLGRP